MIVVIGGSSAIGKYLIEELLLQGKEICATSRHTLAERFLDNKNLSHYILDLTNEEDFKKLPTSNVEAVILLAGLLPANEKAHDPERYKKYFETNTLGTLYTLEYCRKNDIKKIIFAQSHSDVAGLWKTKQPITEDDGRSLNLKGDHAVYIISKNSAVDLIEHYRLEYGIQGISLRLPAVYAYSPRSGMWIDGKFIKAGFLIFIERAMKGETIEIWGNHKLVKDIVYVKDVVQAFIGALESDTAYGLYNIASGIPLTLEDEVKQIIDVFSPEDKKSDIIYCPDKPDTLSYLYDISRAEKDLNYKVHFSFKELLKDYKKTMEEDKKNHCE